jgi:hypothetical protein
VPGQDPCLNERHLADAQVLVKHRMLESLLFALLIGGDDAFASRLGEFDRAPSRARKS